MRSGARLEVLFVGRCMHYRFGVGRLDTRGAILQDNKVAEWVVHLLTGGVITLNGDDLVLMG